MTLGCETWVTATGRLLDYYGKASLLELNGAVISVVPDIDKDDTVAQRRSSLVNVGKANFTTLIRMRINGGRARGGGRSTRWSG